jgi:hypothetical protein
VSQRLELFQESKTKQVVLQILQFFWWAGLLSSAGEVAVLLPSPVQPGRFLSMAAFAVGRGS